MPLDIDWTTLLFNRASGNQEGMFIMPNTNGSGKALMSLGVSTSGTIGAQSGLTEGYYLYVGFAEAMSSGNTIITQRYAAMDSRDNVGTSIAHRMQGQSGFVVYVASGTSLPERRGHITQISGETMRMNWTNISPTAALATSGRALSLAFGGDDVVNAKVGHFTALSGHGNQTHSGVGFSGNILFLASTNVSGASLDVASGRAHGHLMFGMAARPSQQGCWSVLSEDASNTADTKRWQRNDRCVLFMTDAGAATAEAEFVGFTNDGFTLNWISGTHGFGSIINYMVLKISGNIKVGSFNNVSGTDDLSISGVGFSGKVMINTSFNTGENTAVLDHNRITFGGGVTATNSDNIWVGDEDAPTTMVNARVLDTQRIFTMFDELATASGSTQMLLYSFGNAPGPFYSDGFTYNRSTNVFSGSFSGAQILYAVFGDTISGAAAAPQDIQRRAFGGANSIQFPSMAMSDFGGHMVAESDNRAFFGQLRVPHPNLLNVSGQLLY